jgi:hypothetical protein
MAKESEKLYRSITGGNYDSRLKRSLENIKEVCDGIEKRGGRIYVGRVGKLCREEFAGPAAQSIRNKPDTLKRYIDLRAAEQALPIRAGQRENKLRISDPKLRAYVLLLEEQARDSEERAKTLKKLLEKITPVEIDKLIADAFSSGTPLTLPSFTAGAGEIEGHTIPLSVSTRRALEKITSEAHLEQFGLSLYRGRVVDGLTRKFLDKDEYRALLDLLAE